MKRILLILLIATTTLMATDIKLKDGRVITNIKIINETDQFIEFYYKGAKRKVFRTDIESIIASPIRESAQAETPAATIVAKPKIIVGTYRPIYLLPVAALSIVAGIDYLSDASDIKKTMDDYGETSELKRRHTLKTMTGIIAIAAGVVITAVSFNEYNIYATPNSVQVSYRF